MKTEREKITGKVAAAALRLAGEPYTLEPGEENCYLLLVYEGSVQLEYGGETFEVVSTELFAGEDPHHWRVKARKTGGEHT